MAAAQKAPLRLNITNIIASKRVKRLSISLIGVELLLEKWKSTRSIKCSSSMIN